MRIVVIGGSGLVGSKKKLQELGHDAHTGGIRFEAWLGRAAAQ